MVKPVTETTRTISLKIPVDLFEKIELVTHAKIADTFEETVIHILKRGLADVAPAIKEGLSRQLKELDEL